MDTVASCSEELLVHSNKREENYLAQHELIKKANDLLDQLKDLQERRTEVRLKLDAFRGELGLL